MKIMTLLLSLVISSHSFAVTSNLKALLDEHTYFVTVEWDQKDREVFEARNQLFLDEVRKNLSSGVYTIDEMTSLVNGSVDPQTLFAMKQNFKTAVSSGEIQSVSELVTKVSENSYSRGAQWNPVKIGLITLGTIVGVIGLAALVYEIRYGDQIGAWDFDGD